MDNYQACTKIYEYNHEKPELSEDLLEHFGVKGMHWGVRRYQNYDGTRIGSAKSKKKFKNQGNKKEIKSSVKNAQKAVSKSKTSSSNDMKKKIAYMNEHKDEYSTKEINETLNRISAETRLSDMNRQLNPTAKDKAKKILSSRAAKTAAAIGISALAAATVVTILKINSNGGIRNIRSKSNTGDMLVDYLNNYSRTTMSDVFGSMKQDFGSLACVGLLNKLGLGDEANRIKTQLLQQAKRGF